MPACTTVYVLPQPDPHVVWVYPCAPHPTPPPDTGGAGGTPHRPRFVDTGYRDRADLTRPRRRDDDDEVALLIAAGVL